MILCRALGRTSLSLALVVVLGVAGWSVARGQDADLTGFLSAAAALKAGDRASFTALLAGLGADPLYPYLRFADLDLKSAPDAALAAFLAEFPETPLAERVRAAAVTRLAAAGRWADLVRIYREDDDSVERRCLYLRALVETGQAPLAITAARLEPLWLVPHPQPAACEPVFAAWRARGGLDVGLIWRRIRLALGAGDTGLARQLGTRLPAAERPRLERWLAVRARPALVLEPAATAGGDPLAAAVLADGIGRLARTDPPGAATALASGRALLATDAPSLDAALAAVGRALAAAGDPAGLTVWDGMSAGPDNLEAQERRLRAAIGQQDWRRVVDWVGRMPDSPEKRDRWLYWLGRAQAALGEAGAAHATLRQAAAQRSLWGFLAADRLGLPYHLEQRPVPAEAERIGRLAATPAVLRIGLLRRLGRAADMRREWRTLTRSLDAPDLLAAAALAHALRWHDQAIFTLARTDYWDDLELRFPLPYRDLVEEQAWQSGVPADWLYGVIRQESVFNPTVASPVGALGLMQLMPATASAVAGDLQLAPPTPAAILDPGLNIRLGSAYLAQLRDRFGHAALATAAYNAGPHRVVRWWPEHCTDADRWIAAIPFDETRGYVERVLAYRVIYRARLGLEPERLSDWLPPVPAQVPPSPQSAAGAAASPRQ